MDLQINQKDAGGEEKLPLLRLLRFFNYMSPMHQITTRAVNVTRVSMVIP